MNGDIRCPEGMVMIGDGKYWQMIINRYWWRYLNIWNMAKWWKIRHIIHQDCFFLLWCSMQLPSTVPLIILKLSEGFYHGNLHEMACTKWINGKPCEQNHHHHHHHHPKIEKIKGHPIHPTSGSCRRKLATSKRRGSQPPSFRTLDGGKKGHPYIHCSISIIYLRIWQCVKTLYPWWTSK